MASGMTIEQTTRNPIGGAGTGTPTGPEAFNRGDGHEHGELDDEDADHPLPDGRGTGVSIVRARFGCVVGHGLGR